MGFWDKIRLGSALRNIGKAMRWAHETTVNIAGEINPMLRAYYDSKLGSSVEKRVEAAFAVSVYSTLQEVCPNWTWAQNACEKVGAWVAHAAIKTLDVSKLVYQAGKGWINADQVYNEIAKRTTAGIFAVGKVFCKFGPWLKKVSDFLPEDNELSWVVKRGIDWVGKTCLNKLGKNIFTDENRARMEQFVSKGLHTAYTAIRDTIQRIDTAIDKAQQWVQEEVEFIKVVAAFAKEAVKDFCHKVKGKTKTIGRTVVVLGKKLLDNLIGRKK